jgi:hypothetical protein
MVRRPIASEKFRRGEVVCGNVFGLLLKRLLLAMMYSAPYSS